jgi:glycosyltransferase involved in cell wall biosynthesis
MSELGRRAEAACTPSEPELVVGVNLLWCLPGEVGGSEEYLVRQLAGLHDAAPELVTRLFVLPGFAAAHRDVAARHELVVASLDARRRSWRVMVEATWLARRLSGSDVVHHGGGTVPLRSPDPIVLTVHDLQYRAYPAYFTAVRRRYLHLTMPRSVRRATVVAVPSEFVRSSVIEAFGTDPGVVAVVPHGFDPPPPDQITDDAVVRQRYGIGERRFVIYPAITHPHKNHRFLLDLLASEWKDPDLVLVLLGGRGLADDDVSTAVVGHGVEDRVIRPGRVPDADRDGLVVAAEALVYPSEFEGFGAPLLEAMALGTPIVCSDRGALPEVAGDAALVLPLDRDAWAGSLDAVASRHEFMVAAGHRRAAQFTTRAAGERLAAAYRLAAARADQVGT